jgi:hypothetical protein
MSGDRADASGSDDENGSVVGGHRTKIIHIPSPSAIRR